jgi:predicted nucleic acid-binding protein
MSTQTQSHHAAGEVASKLTRLAKRFPKGSELEAELLHAAEQVLNIPHVAYSEGWFAGRRNLAAQVVKDVKA